MSIFESLGGTIPDDLPLSVTRKIQIEELWARRIVLADYMNAVRKDNYASRKALLGRVY